jgi:hypothetical protein
VGVLARRLDRKIVWASNPSGNHELGLRDVREQTVRRLTRDPHVNFFGRFSPDRTRIVFVRSQKEWVSFRDPTAWDVSLIRVNGTGAASGRGRLSPGVDGRREGDRRPSGPCGCSATMSRAPRGD